MGQKTHLRVHSASSGVTPQCEKLRNQRNEMIKEIKNTGGHWPTTNETLVNNYLPIFVKFVQSIDFTELQ